MGPATIALVVSTGVALSCDLGASVVTVSIYDKIKKRKGLTDKIQREGAHENFFRKSKNVGNKI